MSDFDKLLETNSKKKAPAKSKKKNAEIHWVPADVQQDIQALIEAKAAKKVAESDIKKAEVSIIERGLKMQEDKALDGDFQKSFKLGNDDHSVNFVTANKWSFKEEDVADIKEIIGDPDADNLLIKNQTVQLKAEVFKDEELKAKFVEMVGQAFPEFFETIVSHSVSEDFDKRVFDLEENDREDLMVYMKKSKPSIR